jgi:hypothetical protein
LEVCGPRAAAAHGHACLLMMDCDGRVRVAASDPMTVMQSWVRGWYLCLGAAAHRSTSFAASIGHRRQHQHQHQHQHQRQCLLLRRVWPAGGVCASTNARVRERNSRCVCQYCSVHVTCLSTWRIGGSDQQSRVLSVLSCTVCTAVKALPYTRSHATLVALTYVQYCSRVATRERSMWGPARTGETNVLRIKVLTRKMQAAGAWPGAGGRGTFSSCRAKVPRNLRS